MKLNQAVLLLPFVNQVLSCDEYPGFFFVPNKDSNGNDMEESCVDYCDLDFTADLCNDDDDCLAFNTNGWMKHTIVNPLAEVDYGYTCGGLYIKRTCLYWAELKTAIANDQTPDGQQTKYTLCAGTYNLGSPSDTIHLDGKNVVIGCSEPGLCHLDGGRLLQDFLYAFSAVSGSSETMNVELQDLAFWYFMSPPVITWTSGTLTVKNCTFKYNGVGVHASANEGHGAMLIIGITTLVLKESTFFGNQVRSESSKAKSGGVTVLGGSAKIDHCYFRENRSNESGGAIHCSGSGTFCDIEEWNKFEYNEARDGSGGAIFCGDRASCNLNVCEFEGNRSPEGPNVHCADYYGLKKCTMGWVIARQPSF